MNLINRYLFHDIVHYFGLFLLLFVAIVMINEVFDTRREFLAHSPPVGAIVLFLFFSIPENLSIVLPLVGMLGTMMAYGLLARNREILAMIAAGVSNRQLAFPALVFGVALGLFAFWFNESAVPSSVSRARYLEKVVIGGRSETVFTKQRNLFVKGIGSRFYFMQEYLPERGEMVFPTILELSSNGGRLVERIEADRARLAGSDAMGHFWEFSGAKQWLFNPDGTLASYQRYDGPFQLPMEDDLDKFLSKTKKPEEMSLGELIDYVALLRNRSGERVDRYATAMHSKMAYPLACLLMTLLGFASVLDVNARRFAIGAFTGLVIAMGYFGLQAFFNSLGDAGHISPAVAGWTAVATFGAVVAWLLQRLERQGM